MPAAACLLDHTKTDSPALETVELPPSHEVWNIRKAAADEVATLYDQAPVIALRNYAPKVRTCSQSLTLTDVVNQETGEITYKAESWKCHQRHCPICQSARANKLQRQFNAALPEIMQAVPQGVFLLLTLTICNCPITELRLTLSEMGKAWKRLLRKPELKIVKGWIRGTEVTRGESGPMMAHPHYHVLLLVPPSYFKKYYTKHARWVELWQEAARLAYAPAVDIRRVKTAQSGFSEAVKAATYSVKPADLATDPSWFHELHQQVAGLRFLATGGVIKTILSKSGQSDDDLADVTDLEGPETRSRVFGWNRPIRRYRHRKLPPGG